MMLQMANVNAIHVSRCDVFLALNPIYVTKKMNHKKPLYNLNKLNLLDPMICPNDCIQKEKKYFALYHISFNVTFK